MPTVWLQLTRTRNTVSETLSTGRGLPKLSGPKTTIPASINEWSEAVVNYELTICFIVVSSDSEPYVRKISNRVFPNIIDFRRGRIAYPADSG
jgi:hypothetical protein